MKATNMNDQNFWKESYVVETDALQIEQAMKEVKFVSSGHEFNMVLFEKDRSAPCILVSPGSAGHSYVFAELGYRMFLNGYNVFIMPKHGGFTVAELAVRHQDALQFIADKFNDRIGVFAEGLGGFVSFYVSLMKTPARSIAFTNSPAILNEEKYLHALQEGKGAANRRKKLMTPLKAVGKIFPNMKIPIKVYLDFEEMIDPENSAIESKLVKKFAEDPDFDKKYPIKAILSLVNTEAPGALSGLKIPTLFLVPERGFFPAYEKNLFNRLPDIRKELVEIDGGVFWMISRPVMAAKIICDWFNKTM